MTTDREADLRNACKLIIGRQRDIPWRDVPDSDVDGYVDEVRKLDPPAPVLPDVRLMVGDFRSRPYLIVVTPQRWVPVAFASNGTTLHGMNAEDFSDIRGRCWSGGLTDWIVLE